MGKFVDRTGKRYGKLTALKATEKRDKSGSVIWLCKCDCGNFIEISGSTLLKQKSCGCESTKLDNLIGKKFGRLTVVKHIGFSYTAHSSMWECVCDCGNKIKASSSDLKRRHISSCGCYRKDKTKERSYIHGIGNENRIFRIWNGIKNRCYNPNNANYKRYGGRGITMCDEWLNSFINFKEWAVNNGYSENLSIDRIDVNKGYSPTNCRWANSITQNNNRRSNTYFTNNGTTHTAAEWSRIVGIKAATIIARRERGWTDEECINGKIE